MQLLKGRSSLLFLSACISIIVNLRGSCCFVSVCDLFGLFVCFRRFYSTVCKREREGETERWPVSLCVYVCVCKREKEGWGGGGGSNKVRTQNIVTVSG